MTDVKTPVQPAVNTQATPTPVAQAAPTQNSAIKKFEESTVGSVLAKIDSLQKNGNLQLPLNYAPENAIRSAWLLIQQTKDLAKRPALEVCTSTSIANSLLDMVLQGLSPTKKQCYFVVFGNQLTMMRSYFGTIAVAKRVAGVDDAVGIPIYENDVFKYTIDIKTGVKTVTQHDQEFDNIDITKIKAAYAVITYEDGTIEYDIMTMAQIKASWLMGNAKGNSPAHNNFTDQMAAKTVVNRALKIPVNSSNDEDVFREPKDSRGEQVQAAVKHEIAENANGANGNEALGFDEAEEVQEEVSQEAPLEVETIEQQPESAQPVAEKAPVKKAPF